MASNIPVVPEGKSFVLFKKPRARVFSAAIRLSDGYKEVLDTTQTKISAAIPAANARMRVLYRERGLKSASALRQGNGPSPWKIKIRHELGLPITASQKEVVRAKMALARGEKPDPSAEPTNGVAKRRGRPPGSRDKLVDGRRKNVAIGDEQWGEFVKLTENSNTAAMQQITQLLLLGMGAEDFQQTVRAIVVRRLKL